ncbi:MAG TPA: hypothetical protein DEW32_02960, partial [Dehalococcoidia bacterium]|nr:hypothetical protein [Dehalococcoidia bacterium]
GADLSGSRLMGIDFTQTNIDSTRLDGANLGLCSLRLKDFKKRRFVG